MNNILDDCTDKKASKANGEFSYQAASVGKRIAAFIIDSVLSLLPLVIFIAGPKAIIPTMFIAPINPILPLFFYVPDFKPTYTQIAVNLTLLSIFWLYGTVVMLILKNKTIGMLLMSIKVIKANNSNLKVVDVIARQFISKILITSLTFGLSNIISFFWALFSKTNNTVQDKIAGTLVIKDAKGKPVK